MLHEVRLDYCVACGSSPGETDEHARTRVADSNSPLKIVPGGGAGPALVSSGGDGEARGTMAYRAAETGLATLDAW